jgi:hydrogenase expression/formation protein HypE
MKVDMSEPEYPVIEGSVCPVPLRHMTHIVMGHGSGGKMTQELIDRVFKPNFSNPALSAGNDFAALTPPAWVNASTRLAVSTDSHIVAPLFFPGGDIGRLAVCGTVNDVAMSGAVPVALTAGFILEEGLEIEVLEKVVASMSLSAREAGVSIVAGDTKVVEKGKADKLFINTSGYGWVPEALEIGGERAKPGDAVIISGTMGDHGIAVLAARGDLGFETKIESDVAPLNRLIQALLAEVPEVHVLRDPTRGGLATTLNEIAGQSHVNITIDETAVPYQPAVLTACEMLGFDPLYVANEGKVIIILPSQHAEKAMEVLHKQQYGRDAAIIGRVESTPANRVLLNTRIGSTRILDVLAGEMLPRIC